MVTVVPGIFGKQIAYIEDNTAGVQVYFFHADWPKLSEGQMVEVVGERSIAYGEPRIKLSTNDAIQIVDQNSHAVQSVIVRDIESHIGSLVSVAGVVVSITKDTIVLADDQLQEINIRTGVVDARDVTQVRDMIQVTGIARTRGGTTYIQIRDVEDIAVRESVAVAAEVVSNDVLPDSTQSSWFGTFSIGWKIAYGLALLCIGVFVFLLYTLRRFNIRNY